MRPFCTSQCAPCGCPIRVRGDSQHTAVPLPGSPSALASTAASASASASRGTTPGAQSPFRVQCKNLLYSKGVS